MSTEQKAIDSLTGWVAQTTARERGLLLPVSGGSDSALAAFICREAVGEDVRGIYFGEPGSMRCQDWFEQYLPIEIVETRDTNLDPEVERWAHVLTRALAESRITVSTRNKTESILGMYSMASRAAGMHPLIGVWKTDVMRLCEYVGVPEAVMASSKQADADCGRPAELAALTFEQVDTWVKVATHEASEQDLMSTGIGEAEDNYLMSVWLRNRFKGKLPYEGPEVSIG